MLIGIPPPPDAENWLQCWKCGDIIPTRDAKMIGKISGINGVSPVENPNDFKKGIIFGNDSKHRYQRLKQRRNKHPDAEVQRLIEDGFELVSYQNDIPT